MATGHVTAAWRAGSKGEHGIGVGLAGWRVRFEYDAEAIASLKALVPADCREWDAESSSWWVSIEYVRLAASRVLPGLTAYLDQPGLF